MRRLATRGSCAWRNAANAALPSSLRRQAPWNRSMPRNGSAEAIARPYGPRSSNPFREDERVLTRRACAYIHRPSTRISGASATNRPDRWSPPFALREARVTALVIVDALLTGRVDGALPALTSLEALRDPWMWHLLPRRRWTRSTTTRSAGPLLWSRSAGWSSWTIATGPWCDAEASVPLGPTERRLPSPKPPPVADIRAQSPIFAHSRLRISASTTALFIRNDASS